MNSRFLTEVLRDFEEIKFTVKEKTFSVKEIRG